MTYLNKAQNAKDTIAQQTNAPIKVTIPKVVLFNEVFDIFL
jgi:hypothetical protein